MNLAIYDHFLAPSSSRTYSSSLRSSCGDQGPLWILGLRKQFQCSLHCLGVRKALFLAGFRSYNNWDTNFQLSLPCSATASESNRDSAFDHLCVTKRTFFSPSHLNLHLCQLLPETNEATNSQSSLCQIKRKEPFLKNEQDIFPEFAGRLPRLRVRGLHCSNSS